jgi:hypothetical protein
MTSKKWDDPQLDAAQFAIDRFMSAQQSVSDQIADLRQRIYTANNAPHQAAVAKPSRAAFVR